VRKPYPAGAAAPLPVGMIHYEKVTVDATGVITAGIYAGAQIQRITAISPTPEPSMSLLFGIGSLVVCLGSLASRRGGV
jgi:hypothetical protein